MPSNPYKKAKEELDAMKAVMNPPTCNWSAIYDDLYQMEVMTGFPSLTLEQFAEHPDGQGGKMGTKEEWVARKTLEFRRKNDPHFKD